MQSLARVDFLISNKAALADVKYNLPTFLILIAFSPVMDFLVGKEGPTVNKSFSKSVALRDILFGMYFLMLNNDSSVTKAFTNLLH